MMLLSLARPREADPGRGIATRSRAQKGGLGQRVLEEP